MTNLRQLIDELVEAELDEALSCTNGGAPSSRKQAELRQALADARNAIEIALREVESP